VKRQLAAWRRGIDGFLQALESDLLFSSSVISSMRCLSERPRRSSRQTTSMSPSRNCSRGAVEAGAAFSFSAGDSFDDRFAPCPLQCVSLRVEILLARGDSGVADAHVPPKSLRKPSEMDENLP
jgi:hypothetical protein